MYCIVLYQCVITTIVIYLLHLVYVDILNNCVLVFILNLDIRQWIIIEQPFSENLS